MTKSPRNLFQESPEYNKFKTKYYASLHQDKKFWIDDKFRQNPQMHSVLYAFITGEPGLCCGIIILVLWLIGFACGFGMWYMVLTALYMGLNLLSLYRCLSPDVQSTNYPIPLTYGWLRIRRSLKEAEQDYEKKYGEILVKDQEPKVRYLWLETMLPALIQEQSRTRNAVLAELKTLSNRNAPLQSLYNELYNSCTLIREKEMDVLEELKRFKELLEIDGSPAQQYKDLQTLVASVELFVDNKEYFMLLENYCTQLKENNQALLDSNPKITINSELARDLLAVYNVEPRTHQ